MKRYRLTNIEASIVDKIVSFYNMDWLYIDQSNKCYDLDNGKKYLATYTAINDLVEGISQDCLMQDLTDNEYAIFINLLDKLDLSDKLN